MGKPLNVQTKLSKPGAAAESQPETEEKIGLVKKPKVYPRSYRWRENDLSLIEDLVEKVNRVSNRKIDATKVIRGALYLAGKNKPEKLLEAIMEAEVKSMMS